MRALLPDSYSRADLIKYGRLLSGFIHATHSNDAELAVSLLQDVVAEPYRSSHIPGYTVAKKMLNELGALASGISGSGPTMFAVCKSRENADQVAAWLASNYLSQPGGFVKVCRISETGTHCI
jgi:homoserine kinase